MVLHINGTTTMFYSKFPVIGELRFTGTPLIGTDLGFTLEISVTKRV